MHKRIQQQYGVSMIEVLITIIILAVGLLGIAATQSVAVKETGSSSQRTAAMFLINDLVERMHSNPAAIDNYMSALKKDQACTTVNPRCTSAQCNAKQRAEFDAWEVACKGKGSLTKSGNINYLADAKVYLENKTCSTDTVSCTVDIAVEWTESVNKRKQSNANKGKVFIRTAL